PARAPPVAGGCPACPRSQAEAQAGTSVRDKKYAAIMQKVTARAIGLKRNIPSSEVSASGQRTRSVQIVETSSGIATWLAPRKADSPGGYPIARCRSVFSRQITALSTI